MDDSLPRAAAPAALLIDFDNTITRGDVLDSLIGAWSRSDRWTGWQGDWESGRISTLECLGLQMGDLAVERDALLAHVRRFDIDPHFAGLQGWARAAGVPLAIASDNFEPIVREILAHHAIVAPPIYANALEFTDGGVRVSFPHSSPTCPRCANCKSTHFARYPGRRIIYVGDGLSDVCPAMRADLVFAKDALADHLARQGRPFLRFAGLGDVVRMLRSGSLATVRAVPA